MEQIEAQVYPQSAYCKKTMLGVPKVTTLRVSYASLPRVLVTQRARCFDQKMFLSIQGEACNLLDLEWPTTRIEYPRCALCFMVSYTVSEDSRPGDDVRRTSRSCSTGAAKRSKRTKESVARPRDYGQHSWNQRVMIAGKGIRAHREQPITAGEASYRPIMTWRKSTRDGSQNGRARSRL